MVDIKKIKTRMTWFLIITLVLSLFEIQNAKPAIITVDDDNPADYSSIQDAIDSASGGDTIYVHEGIYHEHVTVYKEVKLKGENKRAVIECLNEANGISVTANNVEIDGFEIRNSQDGYYGIELKNVENCIIKNCNLSNCHGGINLYNGREHILMMNIFYKNSYGLIGVGVWNSTIRENFFVSNSQGINFGSDTRYNVFFYNTFITNVISAYDDSIFNQWYYSNVGNYWDNYNGVDEDGDGIGDTKYQIEPPERGRYDYYPLMQPYTGYDIFPPDIIDLKASPQIQIPNGSINITCTIIDNVKVNFAFINITTPEGSHINNSLMWINGTDSYYFNISFSTKGVYYYYIWANDTNNNSEKSSIKKFAVAYKPTANFTYTPSNPTDLDYITFNASMSFDVDGYIANYSWDFENDGIIDAYGEEVTYIYTQNSPPVYTVNLTIYDNDGAWDYIEKDLFISNVIPRVNFSFSPPNAIVGQTIQFNDLSYDLDGDIVYWIWDFGDGTTIEGGRVEYKNPVHSYSMNGIFNITLTVLDDDYESNSTMRQITVEDVYPPVIENLTAYPNPQEIYEYVNISCNLYDDVEVAKAIVNISLPNGSIIEDSLYNNGNKYYYSIYCDQPGTYYYYIYTADSSNNTNISALKNFTIIIPPEPPHIENVSITPPVQQYGYNVNISCYVYDNVAVGDVWLNFSNVSTKMNGITDEKGNGIYYYNSTFEMGLHEFYIYTVDINGYENVSSNYSFEIIDTLPPTILNVNFDTFSPPGELNISCNIYDNRGVKRARINVSTPNGSINETMLSLNDLFYMNFSFNIGHYSFFIWAEDVSNNSAHSPIYNFTVTHFPVANFSYMPLNPTTADLIQFTSSSYDSDGYIVNYTWDFGDGSFAYGESATHQYSDDGIYNVVLVVRDDDGATDSITKQINVSNVPPHAITNGPYYAYVNESILFNASMSYDSDGYIVN
ncbi:MAG TPA: PKD domain-containing protein, partial [Thermoplasmatales archaeon]|nr:PKD domain-containing protein [Thermoplasmatales archaeon]